MLIAHYPLIEDFKDLITGNTIEKINLENEVAIDDAKFGWGYRSKNMMRILPTDYFKPGDEMSLSVHYRLNEYPDATTPKTGNVFSNLLYSGMGIAWTSDVQNVFKIKSFFRASTPTADPPDTNIIIQSAEKTITTNVDYHIVFVKRYGSIEMYIDGELFGYSAILVDGNGKALYNTEKFAAMLTSASDNGYCLNNKYLYGGINTNIRVDCTVQDARIYDHALSKKEIKELYNAKVFHYDFNDLEEPTENLISDDDILGTTVGKDTFGRYWTKPTTVWNENMPILRTTAVQAGVPVTFQIEIYMDYKPIAAMFDTNVAVAGSVGNDFYTASTASAFSIVPGKWNLVSVTVTPNADLVNAICFHAIMIRIPTEAIGKKIYYRNAKLSHTPYSTPYSPKGLNQTYITDKSGMGNDLPLEKNLSPIPVTALERGILAARFDGTKVIRPISTKMGKLRKAFTVIIDFKPDAIDTQEVLLSCTENGGWSLNKNQYIVDNLSFPVYLNGTYKQISITKGELSVINSNRIAVTFDGRYIKMYLNGILKNTFDNVITEMVSYNPNNGVVIGAEAFSNLLGYSNNYKGSIEELIMHARPLSAQEILEDYQVRGSIDKLGNINTNHLLMNLDGYDEVSGQYNLLRNGCLEFGNANHVSGGTYNGVDNCMDMTATSENVQFLGCADIEIFPLDEYVLEFEVMATNADGNILLGVITKDTSDTIIDIKRIFQHPSAVKTTLKQPINPGDTVVYINDVTGWSNEAPLGTLTSQKKMAFWRADSIYPKYTISEAADVLSYIDINYVANTITLAAPWSGSALEINTPVANYRSGGTYLYPILQTLPTTWTKLQVVISNINTSWAEDLFGTKFRFGSAKFTAISMYGNFGSAAANLTKIRNVRLYNKTRPQKLPPLTISEKPVNSKGVMTTTGISELGIVDGLECWFELDKFSDTGKVSDALGMMADGVVTVATPDIKAGKECFKFITGSIIKIPTKDFSLAQRFSFCIESYKDATQGSTARLVHNNKDSFSLHASADWINIQCNNYDKTIWKTTATAFPLNVWTHIFITFDGVFLLCYMDGILIKTLDTRPNPGLYIGMSELLIGNYTNLTQSFIGWLRNFRFYSRVLDPKEVKLQYLFDTDQLDTSISKGGMYTSSKK